MDKVSPTHNESGLEATNSVTQNNSWFESTSTVLTEQVMTRGNKHSTTQNNHGSRQQTQYYTEQVMARGKKHSTTQNKSRLDATNTVPFTWVSLLYVVYI